MREKSSSKAFAWTAIAIVVVAAGFFIMRMNTSSNQNEGVGGNFPSGLNVTVLQGGSGEKIESGSIAIVHYTGALDDGTVFDSSIPRGAPFEFTLGAGQVIQGWDLGVAGMRVGEKRQLIIAPELAYGAAGQGPIPPNSTLTFEVELVAIR